MKLVCTPGPLRIRGVDSGQHFQLFLVSQKFPTWYEPCRVKHNDSGFERSFVKFIITNQMTYAPGARLAKKKSASFVRAVSALTQLLPITPP